MIQVDITYQAEGWIEAFDMSEDTIAMTIQRICRAVYAEFEEGDAEVSVVLADNAFVQSLNKQYRGKNQPTNVLSFPASDGFCLDGMVEPLGDIVIALETVVTESEEQEKRFYNHFTHLIVHGMLHLLGMDHIVAKEAEEMEALEIELLKSLGVNDPYMGTDIIG